MKLIQALDMSDEIWKEALARSKTIMQEFPMFSDANRQTLILASTLYKGIVELAKK